LALKNDECTWETAGGYLHHLNLIPDLKLKEEDVQARLLRNGDVCDQLSDTEKTIFLAIEAMVNKGLIQATEKSKKHLLEFFRNQNQVKVRDWTEKILTDKDWLKKSVSINGVSKIWQVTR
jgi:hypothetical protein